MKITRGSHVEIHYQLYDPEGELVESTEDEEPVLYIHGDEEILPGLERSLEGREAGEEFEVELGPEDAYGAYNPEGLLYVPKADLPDDLDITPGEWITVGVDSDDEEEGETADEDDEEDDEEDMEMRVVEIHEDEVVLDANHPLAGKRVSFKVRVLAVRPS